MSVRASPRLPFTCSGRHVVGRAHGGGETGEGQSPQSGRLGNAEIHDANAAIVAEHDVFRLQVAMDDVLPVHVLQGLADAAGNRQGIAARAASGTLRITCRSVCPCKNSMTI